MSLFDIFNTSNADNAANAQVNSLNAAKADATTDLNTGVNNLKTSYAAGLSPLLQNYSAIAPGVTAYGNATGANGPSGNQQAVTDFQGSPGYQYTVDQATQNADRNAAATGQLNSGNTTAAVAGLTQNLANQNWQQYVTNLLPYLGAATTTGGQIATTASNEGNQLLGAGTTQANIDYGSDVGQGNAIASADLAGNNASANAVNAAMNGGKLAAQLFGFL